MTAFGEQLRALRKARHLTVNQLAIYSGVSSATISRIENGKRGIPKPATIRKLADTLKMPYENLMAAAGHITPFRMKSAKRLKAINPSIPYTRQQLPIKLSTSPFSTVKNGSISPDKILKT